MKIIYIDSDFKCHVTDDGTMTAVETNSFDGKCDAYIEGYRFIPEGESWTRSDGVVFHGEMIAPFKPYDELIQFQSIYDETKAAIAEKEERIAMLEKENAMLTQCILEMSEIVYV